MQIVSDVRCAPRRHNLGIHFEGILYQRRMRSISELIFRNVSCLQTRGNHSKHINVCFKSLSGSLLHYSRKLDKRKDFIYRNFKLSDTEYDNLLSTKSFLLELCDGNSNLYHFTKHESEVGLHWWKIDIDKLLFIGSSIQSGGSMEMMDLQPTEFVGSSIYYLSQLQFKPNSLVLVFNDSYYCSPDSIQNIGAFNSSTIYPKIEPPLLKHLSEVNFTQDKFKVLDDHRLRLIHTNALVVQQKRKERNSLLAQVNSLIGQFESMQKKLERIEYLSGRTNTMMAEKTRLICENQNFKFSQEEKRRELSHIELNRESMRVENKICSQTVSEVKSKLSRVQHKFNLVRKKKQLVRGYILNELQSIFSISEKLHSPLDSKIGRFGTILNKLTASSSQRSSSSLPRDGHASSDDTHWYICGLWLPKSEVFDPCYRQQATARKLKPIDASKVDDFEIVTAVCYVAWVLVIISQVSATVLRYQIDMCSFPSRWYIVDNQIDLKDYRENRQYDLVLDRKLRVKDDFRFLHALFCLNKNIGQLRHKLNLTSGCFTIHKTLRDLSSVLKFLSNRGRLQAAYEKVRTASSSVPMGRSLLPSTPSIDSLSVAYCDSASAPSHHHSQQQHHSSSKLCISPSTREAARKFSAVEISSKASSCVRPNNGSESNLDADLEAMLSQPQQGNHAYSGGDSNGDQRANGDVLHMPNGATKSYPNIFISNFSTQQQPNQNSSMMYSLNDSIAEVKFRLPGVANGASAFFQEQEGDEDEDSSEEEEEEDEMISSAAAIASYQNRQQILQQQQQARSAALRTSRSRSPVSLPSVASQSDLVSSSAATQNGLSSPSSVTDVTTTGHHVEFPS